MIIHKVANLEEAQRLARTIASDVALYNQKKLEEGVRNVNLFDVLHEEIETGRELFIARMAKELRDKVNLYDRAIVDIIVKQSANFSSKIW